MRIIFMNVCSTVCTVHECCQCSLTSQFDMIRRMAFQMCAQTQTHTPRHTTQSFEWVNLFVRFSKQPSICARKMNVKNAIQCTCCSLIFHKLSTEEYAEECEWILHFTKMAFPLKLLSFFRIFHFLWHFGFFSSSFSSSNMLIPFWLTDSNE